MVSLEILIGLLVAVVVLVRLARWLELPPAIALLVGGLGLSFVPGFRHVELPPEAIFTLFLPPLLFYAAYLTSWRDFRRNARPIGLLAIGLVVATTLLVGFVAHLVIPGLSLAAAFALGAIVSPTDAIAATSITERIGVPRRIITVLEGESLVNDASGIVAYRLAVAAVVTGAFSLLDAGWQFVWSSAGGVAVGLAVGGLLMFFDKRIDDAPVENTISIITPFAAYILAEKFLHVSGVLAVVTAGLYFRHHIPRVASSQTRLQGTSFWQMLEFLFNSALFLLVGLQLRRVVAGLGGLSLRAALGYAIVISLAVILTRIVWVYPATYVPRWLSRKLRERDPAPPWQTVFVIAWTGMRGAISLAAALSLPLTTATGADFPQRNLIVFLSFAVILATLVVQGLSLPPIIRWLKLRDDGATAREEAAARVEVLQAALHRIKELADEHEAAPKLLERAKQEYRHRFESAEVAAAESEHACREFFRDERLLRLEIVKAERAAIVRLRESGALHDGAVRHIERDLDLEEQRLQDHDHLPRPA